MHMWGDDWFKKHGKEFNEAIDWVDNFWYKFKVPIYVKEKYGTMRAHVYWVHKCDLPWGLRFNFVAGMLNCYIKFMYGLGYYLVCRKYPHFEKELTTDADWLEVK